MPEIDDDLLITPAMRLRFDLEATPDHVSVANDFPWMAFVQRSNGEVHRFANQRIHASDFQQIVAMRIVRRMNKEIAHDGTWVGGWVHPEMEKDDAITLILSSDALVRPFRRLIFMFVDADGDAQFTVEVEDHLKHVFAAPMGHWIDEAETAWQHWHRHMHEILGRKPEETFKRAQGQTAPSRNQRNYQPLNVDFSGT